MATITTGTLTVADIAYVLEVLQQAQDLPPTADAYSIGILRARAFSAAVIEDAIYMAEEEDQAELADREGWNEDAR